MILYTEKSKKSALKVLQLISTARFQDTRLILKNELNFYILTMNNLKKKLRKELHLQEHQKENT